MTSKKPSTSPPKLQIRGAIQEGYLYIERTADTQLRQALLEGDYCYVLAPRQIGKSSLRLHTARGLVRAGIRCVHIDLCGIGGQDDDAPISGWYFSLISAIAEQLHLDDPLDFWSLRGEALPVFHFRRYLREQVLTQIPDSIVIFIDEIDYLRSLSFDTDEFIDSIRATYEARGIDDAWRRLTFCLLGVTAPSDLIRNSQITPFNIGTAIAIEDFRPEEFEGFGLILNNLGPDVTTWLKETYKWTSGHPYMTQALFQMLFSTNEDSISQIAIEQRVERAVDALFLRYGRSPDPNLAYAETRLESKDNQKHKAELLALYRRLLEGAEIPVDGGNRLQQELQLCGIVAPRGQYGKRCLYVRNKIFANVFDLAWVRKKEGERKLTQALRLWRAAGNQSSALLYGIDLEEAEAWALENPDQVTQDENLFLRVSLANAHKRTQRTITRILGVGLAVMGIFTVSLAWLYQKARDARSQAETQAQKASAEKAKAEENAIDAQRSRERSDRFAKELEAALTAQRELVKKAEEEKQRAQALVNQTGKELQAALLAMQHERRIQVLVRGMQAVQTERAARISRLWDPLNQIVEEMVLSTVYRNHTNKLWSIAFSSDDKLLVTTSDDKTAQVWDSRNGESLYSLIGHQDTVRSAIFTSDNRTIITASDDRTIRIWDTDIRKDPRVLNAHNDKVLSVSLDAAGKYIASSSADKTAAIWELSSGKFIRRFSGHSDWVRTVVFSPDGKKIVTASDDKTARVWDSESGQLIATFTGHLAKVRNAAISPDGKQAVTASDDRSARIWDITSGNQVFSLQGHSDWVRTAKFSPDGRQILTAGDDTTVRIWDRETGRAVTFLQGHSDWIRDAVFSHDGRRVATASADRTARVWDLQAGRFLIRLEGHSARVWSAFFSSDGKKILTASDDRTAKLWDVEMGQPNLTLAEHTDFVRFATMSPNGKYVLTASTDGNVRVWPTNNAGKSIATIAASKRGAAAAAFSPDGASIAIGGSDGSVSTWESGTGRHLIDFGKHNGKIRSIAYAPNGKMIVTASDDTTARIWNAETGTKMYSLRGHTSYVWHASFSPDNLHVLTSGQDKTVRIWDAATGTPGNKLVGHLERVWSAYYSNNNEYIVSASDDGTARLWAPHTGQQLLTLRGHTGGVLFASFSPDGRRVVTAGDDKIVLIHSIEPKGIFDFACRILRTVAGHPDAPTDDIQNLLLKCPEQ